MSGSYYTLNAKYNQLLALIQKYIAAPPVPGSQDLASVLALGNSAGAFDINLNSNDITNVSLINGSPYPPAPPATPGLSSVLTASDNAGGLDIQNLDNLGVNTINGSAYPPVVPADALQAVLNAGNTATGANAKIGLTDSGIGNVANPQLILNNSNATAGTINGVPCVEYFKSGRNATTGDTIATQTFQAKNASGTKTEYARLETAVRGTGVGNDDGSLGFYFATNGTLAEVFRMNGADNENNSYRPLDLNGNALKTATGNMDITTIGSTGTGNLTISSKANLTETALGVAITSTGTAGDSITLTSAGNINLIPASGGGTATFVRTDSSIQTLTSSGGNKIDFAGGNADERFNIDKTEMLLHWNNAISDQSTITIESDIASLNNVISQVYQSGVNSVSTIIQNIPSVQRLQQLDTINLRQSELSPAKVELINTAAGTTMLLNNNLGSYQNELILSANDSVTPLSTQAKISNTPTNQYLTLVNNNSGTSNAKTLTLINETSVSPSLSWVNNIDTIPFNISSNQDLNVGANNDLNLSSALADVAITGNQNITITSSNTAPGVGAGVNLTANQDITLNVGSALNLNGSFIYSASNPSTSAGSLLVNINGTAYKIALFT